ncbi:MAG: MoaD/ThiS family protein [Candidatus Odinarchaeota archaeon]
MTEEAENISVIVKFFAEFRKYGPDKAELTVPKGSKVQYLLEKYKIPSTKQNMIVLINGLPHKKADDKIEDGDIIAIFPPIAGG